MKTILFVDDDRGFRELCKRVFQEEGYRVVLAEDGVEAFHAVAADSPDVAVLDVRMPGMTGFEVAKELSVIAPQLPVILYTANDDMCTADRRSCLAAACVDKHGLHRVGDGRDPGPLAGRTRGRLPHRTAAAAGDAHLVTPATTRLIQPRKNAKNSKTSQERRAGNPNCPTVRAYSGDRLYRHATVRGQSIHTIPRPQPNPLLILSPCLVPFAFLVFLRG